MSLLRKMFGNFYMNEEGGDSVSSSGGGDSSASDSSSSESVADAPSGSPAAGSDDGEPKSMMDAMFPESSGGEQKNVKPDGAPEAKQQDASRPQETGQPAQKPEEAMHQMPEGLAPRAQERFRALSEKVKEQATHIETLSQSAQQGLQAVQSVQNFFKETGASPQDMNSVAAYLKAANSGDFQTEANMLMSRLREIQMETGMQFESVQQQLDPLQQFPELAEAVASYQITREHALEIARARSMQAGEQQQQQQTQERQQQVGQWQQGKSSAISTIKQWETEMMARDPDYSAIAPLIMGNKEAMGWIVQNVPPSAWHHHLTMLYNQTKSARQTFVPAGSGSANRPLSGSGGKPQGSSPKAKTMFEAMFPNG